MTSQKPATEESLLQYLPILHAACRHASSHDVLAALEQLWPVATTVARAAATSSSSGIHSNSEAATLISQALQVADSAGVTPLMHAGEPFLLHFRKTQPAFTGTSAAALATFPKFTANPKISLPQEGSLFLYVLVTGSRRTVGPSLCDLLTVSLSVEEVYLSLCTTWRIPYLRWKVSRSHHPPLGQTYLPTHPPALTCTAAVQSSADMLMWFRHC